MGGKIIGRDSAPAALSALARMCSQPLPKSGNDPFHGATLRSFLFPWEVLHLLFFSPMPAMKRKTINEVQLMKVKYETNVESCRI